jgi:hypothetical protein
MMKNIPEYFFVAHGITKPLHFCDHYIDFNPYKNFLPRLQANTFKLEAILFDSSLMMHYTPVTTFLHAWKKQVERGLGCQAIEDLFNFTNNCWECYLNCVHMWMGSDDTRSLHIFIFKEIMKENQLAPPILLPEPNPPLLTL